MSKYKCPTCSVVADIDKSTKKVTVFLTTATRIFPIHPDCELAKAVDAIDLSKLEKVG